MVTICFIISFYLDIHRHLLKQNFENSLVNNCLQPQLCHVFIQKQFRPIHQKIVSSFSSDQLSTISNTTTTYPMKQPSSNLEATTTTTSETTQNEKITKFENTLFIHYTYEKRFQSMKRDLHMIYEDLFSQSANGNVKMIVGTRNRRSAYHELIRKRPPRFLLKDIERPSNEYFSLFLSDTYCVHLYLTRETEENSSDERQDCV